MLYTKVVIPSIHILIARLGQALSYCLLGGEWNVDYRRLLSTTDWKVYTWSIASRNARMCGPLGLRKGVALGANHSARLSR